MKLRELTYHLWSLEATIAWRISFELIKRKEGWSTDAVAASEAYVAIDWSTSITVAMPAFYARVLTVCTG